MYKSEFKCTALFILCFIGTYCCCADSVNRSVFPGADEATPSRSEYFSWINNTNEGATEEHTLINLEFFKWLQDEYGMVLDIYAFDAGAVDGKHFYGKVGSERFLDQFPNGFTPIYKKAKSIQTRLGLWGGPDGYGNTEQQAQGRIDMMVALCRDFEWALFKFDLVCGPLRDGNEKYFIEMMDQCREYSPDLIALNHRLGLSDEGKARMTTFLLGGKETYIDVHMANTSTSTHHRQGAISRELPQGLTRLTEDHGVCISSCNDFWDDDLILQAFNRCLILAPQIYGSPWLLPDDQYPKLARIFNLHRRYRDILVNGKTLPDSYGPHAVSRGNDKIRFITLRNLTWESVPYLVKLGSEIGLKKADSIEFRQFHPTEKVIGTFKYNDTFNIEVLPFQACLLMATVKPCDEISVQGSDYRVVKDIPGKPVEINLLGMPGDKREISLPVNCRNFSRAVLDGKDVELLGGKTVAIEFAGAELTKPYHRKLAQLKSCKIPSDAKALYEASIYSADNNTFEVRELLTSGPTVYPAVKTARDAFFDQHILIGRGVWDRYMFDGDKSTTFYPMFKTEQRINGGALRVDFGTVISPDCVDIIVPDQYSLLNLRAQEGNLTPAEFSVDLKSWFQVRYIQGEKTRIYMPKNKPFRYMRISEWQPRVAEIYAYKDGNKLDRTCWRGSNLFSTYEKMKFNKAWSGNINIDQAAPGSYFCVAVNGHTGNEGAYVGIRAKDDYIGAPDRAPSYRCNGWENDVSVVNGNYTFYIPVTDKMLNRDMEVFVLGTKSCKDNVSPDVWITTGKAPFVSKRLILE